MFDGRRPAGSLKHITRAIRVRGTVPLALRRKVGSPPDRRDRAPARGTPTAACAYRLLRRAASALCGCLLFAAPFPAPAQLAALGAYLGRGQGIDVYGIEGVASPECECAWLEERDLKLDVLLHAALWDAYRHPSHGTLGDFALFGALGWGRPEKDGWRPTVEAALGVHGLTRVDIGNQNMGSAFQFGERLAGGVEFGGETRWAITGFIEHVSNANIKQPNDGLTYGGVDIRVMFP